MDMWHLLEADLEADLKKYEYIVTKITHLLIVYENKISSLIVRIANTESISEAESDFEEIFKIQRQLFRVQYVYEFNLPKRLSDFVYLLDRDDSYSKQYWYDSFKKGNLWPSEAN